MTAPALFDPGLQPERTALAWRRTALSLTVGSLIALRVLPAAFLHPGWYVPGALGLAVAAWLWRVSHVRYRSFELLAPDAEPRLPGGGALAATAAYAVAAGAVALVAVILNANG